MSILIKGMDMPRNCHTCCFFGQADIWESDFDGYTKSFCKRTGSQTYDYVDKFLPNCPLVPVPPHGRLIDGDVAEGIYFTEEDENGKDFCDGILYAADWISEQPTIIPADPPREET